MAENTESGIKIAFAAIDKEIENLIPINEDVEGGRQYVQWGRDNLYPQYLYGLYEDVASLKTVIDGTADYTCGNDVRCTLPGFTKEVNTKGDSVRDLVWLCARDYLIYGGFAIQVIRSKIGHIRELYWLDYKNLRSSKYNDVIYYSEEFGKRYVRSNKTIIYPKFMSGSEEPVSVLYVKNEKSRTYPVPRYSGAIKSCEIERRIDTFHLSSLENGFAGSYIINFLNGIPTDEQKEEIERNINEKFAGSSNAGRILINFANGKDNATDVQKLDVDDYGDKYRTLAERSRQQIFVSFRAIPQLFGDMTAATGFNSQEFSESFKVFNRTVVMPVQQKIIDAINRILNVDAVIIEPFTLEGREQTIE